MTMSNIISNNSDFLFLYEAINCNPNGDPDQENKPRMDYDTQRNLVTDVRLKRYIRDYLANENYSVFVDLESDAKVSMETKMDVTVSRLLAEDKLKNIVFENHENYKSDFEKIISERKDDESIFKALKNKKNSELNQFILTQLVKESFIDIRMFGSAFAIEGFKKAITGPIQINWGYSLNKVELVESDSIVTIMNEGDSTFGKDYRLYYSLLAFTGTINKHAAKTTSLKDEDLELFRKSIWDAIPSLPTRSKLNQYPKLYLEIIYNDGFNNGHFGDLRDLISTSPKVGIEDKKVRSFSDLQVDYSKLKSKLQNSKAVKDIIIKKTDDIEY